MNTELVREVMTLLVDTVRERKPDAAYRMVPGRGWYTLDENVRIETPLVGIVPIESLETLPAYTLVCEDGRILWRLVREPKVSWYYLCQMAIDEDDTVVFRYYALSVQQLASLLVDRLGQPPQPQRQPHNE